jgi:RNA polymerase sigma factor (sigma-70 family)
MTRRRNDRLRLVQADAQIEPETGGVGGLDLEWSILMARAQDGDAAAYLRLLEQITPYLRSRSARYLRDSRDIEDTVQDILLTVHAVRRTYDPSRPFGPWLLAIANRRAFDKLRRRIREQARETPLTEAHESVAPEPAAGESGADAHRLSKAIRDLPPSQREAIRLLKLEERTLKEAATISSMSVASLKMATHRALRRLRDLLAERSGP